MQTKSSKEYQNCWEGKFVRLACSSQATSSPASNFLLNFFLVKMFDGRIKFQKLSGSDSIYRCNSYFFCLEPVYDDERFSFIKFVLSNFFGGKKFRVDFLRIWNGIIMKEIFSLKGKSENKEATWNDIFTPRQVWWIIERNWI